MMDKFVMTDLALKPGQPRRRIASHTCNKEEASSELGGFLAERFLEYILHDTKYITTKET